MNMSLELLPASWYYLAAGLYVLALIPALWTAPWQRFQHPQTIHVFLGSCVALLLLWHITTTEFPGLNYHYIGATLLTLMFGWQLALLGFSLVYLGMMFNGSSEWQTLPLNILVMGLVPILTSQLIYWLVDRKLPNHFFVYLFLNAFFGAALALLVMIGVASGLLLLADTYTFPQLAHDYFPFLPLMMFPEAFITGMLTAILVVMTPGWVGSFDDRRYLHGK